MQETKPVVYLVDDDPSVLNSLARALRQYSYEVETHSSAQSFLDAYEGGHGCLVLDLSMPDMDGLELQDQLMKSNGSLPVIFITGHGGVPESVQAIKAGAIDFLEKPFPTEVLLQRVEEALKAAQIKRSSLQVRDEIIARFALLTDRERDVYQLLIDSDTNTTLPSSKEIAKILGISHRTVEHHRSRILEKTKTRSVVELQLLSKEVGVIPGT